MELLGATLAIALFQSTASPLIVWRIWFASCLLGIVTVAPLLVGTADAVRNLPPRREIIEGVAGIVTLAALSALVISLQQGPWSTALPVILVFPVLLWIAVRCRPVFAAGAAFVVASALVWSITFNVGHFGDTGIPLADRMLAVQTIVLVGALLTLVLAALFAERRRSEVVLAESKARLADALAAGGVVAFEWDAKTGTTQRSENAAGILGFDAGMTASRRNDFLRWVHPDDRDRFRACIRELHPSEPSYALCFRFKPSDSTQIWLEETAKAEFDPTGQLLRVKGLTRDITERKLAELALAERNTQLDLASKIARVGSFAIDFATGLVNLSPGCATIMGLPESTVALSRDNGRRFMHPEDLARFDAERDQAFLKKQREFVAQFRIIRADNGELRWIEARSIIFYDQGDQPLRLIAVIIDFTERKMAEQALTERNAQLALAGQTALVGNYAYDVDTGVMQISEGYSAIHGLPAGTRETTLSEWRSRVHPEDVGRIEAFRGQMFASRQKEYNIEYRIVRSDGEIRWIERRSSISYDCDGRPERVVGVNIDVTDRKRAEERQRILVAELDHRVKNALATVSSMISHTAVGSRSMADFIASIDGRIRSMATTQELLRSGQWDGISLRALIQHELAPYATHQNTQIRGPEVVLRPEAGQAIAMVIHELATNAAKYGALSTQDGSVSIRWDRRLNGQPHRLAFEWQEMGGPLVVAPEKSSFGMNTIRDLIPYEFGGKVDFTFAREGVWCRVELPADWLSSHEPAPKTVAA